MRWGYLRQEARFAVLSNDTATLWSDAPWSGGAPTGATRPYTLSDLGPPAAPGKIVCVGRNYAGHAKELKNPIPEEPLLFLKPPSSLVGPGDAVLLPPQSARVEHEVELAVVMGKSASCVSAEAALSFVFGYTVACDVTARDLQRKDVQFTRAKGFDTFCPLGPWIETDLDPWSVNLRAEVSGTVRQDGNTRDMIFSVPVLLSFISHVMTLEPGDVILTGTPEGVGPLVPSDTLTLFAENIGGFRLPVRTR